jgi:carboxyl-terminal processing protease
MRGIQSLLIFLPCFLLIHTMVRAQPVDIVEQPEHKNYILNAVVSNILAKHYTPKAVDNKFSESVWNDFLHYLDSNHIIFLQEDLNKLQAHLQSIDDELKTGSPAFFDALISIYRNRMAEISLLYPKILSTPFDLQQKEFYHCKRKDKPFPSGIQERTEDWKRMLKFYFLKRAVAVHHAREKNSVARQLLLDAAQESKIRVRIRQQYDAAFHQQLTNKAITEKFYQYVNIITMQMDPHSNFMVPDMNRAGPGIDGKPFYSAGITLAAEGQDIYIHEILPGSAAHASGKLTANDRIIAIRDSLGKMEPVSGKSMLEVSFLLSGKKDSNLTMLLENDAMEERLVSIPRDEMKYNSYKMRSAIITKDGKKTGYIYFPFFYGSFNLRSDIGVEADLLRELAKLKGQEVQSLIIDLRGNPGGSTSEATWMLNDLLGVGDVAILKGKYSQQVLSNYSGDPVFKGPLTVLVDESSASSSELLAAAIQDHGRGIVIGTASTFGKGTAQTTISINSSNNGKATIHYGNLKLTEKKFYRINGASTQFKGVIPDIVLQQRMSNTSIREIDYPTALPSDTLKVDNYKPAKMNFDYQLVVKKAQERIRGNIALQTIENSLQALAKLNAAPYPLDWQGFITHTQERYLLEEKIRKARELKPGLLPIESSLPPWINPHTLLPFEHLQYEHWLNKLQQDIYLLEAVSVTEDLMSNIK